MKRQKIISNIAIIAVTVASLGLVTMTTASATPYENIQASDRSVSSINKTSPLATQTLPDFGDDGAAHTSPPLSTGNGSGHLTPSVPTPPPSNPSDTTVINYELKSASRIIDYRVGPMTTWWATVAQEKCTPSDIHVGAKVTYTYHVNPNDDGAIVLNSYRLVGVTCLSLSYNDYDRTCYVDGTVSISKVTPAPTTNVVPSSTSKTPWGNGDHSLNGCVASDNISVSLFVTLSEYGRYRSQTHLRYQTVKIRDWNPDPITGADKPSDILSESGLASTTTKYNYAQLTCVGGTSGRNQSAVWVGSWSWTETDCGPTNSDRNPVKYTCSATEPPTFNGEVTASANIFRSGDKNTLSWQTSSVIGNISGTPTLQATKISRSGTPWKTGVPASNNDIELRYGDSNRLINDAGTDWIDGTVNTNWDFRATWASSTNQPTVLTPLFRYNANWITEVIVISSINLITGDLVTSRRTSTVNADAICTGSPMSILVTRSINS